MVAWPPRCSHFLEGAGWSVKAMASIPDDSRAIAKSAMVPGTDHARPSPSIPSGHSTMNFIWFLQPPSQHLAETSRPSGRHQSHCLPERSAGSHGVGGADHRVAHSCDGDLVLGVAHVSPDPRDSARSNPIPSGPLSPGDCAMNGPPDALVRWAPAPPRYRRIDAAVLESVRWQGGVPARQTGDVAAGTSVAGFARRYRADLHGTQDYPRLARPSSYGTTDLISSSGQGLANLMPLGSLDEFRDGADRVGHLGGRSPVGRHHGLGNSRVPVVVQ